ncbi:fumarate hydratase [Candidatus Acetothermia bacterium]|jgi:fumarate hydratase subunit alpha|nr:fumarate hydratase [Candidatus Acetothermia bacterium]MCI2426962.1 fumarate hydratase [Candidatus Acetothermia bacterium]MCI2428516.1 fumarate hydratase [Candidatus Acetothermia bacterium]
MDEEELVAALITALQQATTLLPQDVVVALQRAEASEDSPLAKQQLQVILQNIEIAKEHRVPLCQDTGLHTFFITAGTASPYLSKLQRIIKYALAEATQQIPLRPNTVHPFTNENSGDNLGRYMPYLSWDLVDGDEITITILPKGAGSENMSTLKMLLPTAGISGIKRAVVDHIIACGGKPCPPTIVGIGIGGGADIAMNLGKRALLRSVGDHHPEPMVAVLEEELVHLLNMSGVGPMGIGGKNTVLAVHVEYAYRHTASLPVGIVIQCWAHRWAKVHLASDGTIEVR